MQLVNYYGLFVLLFFCWRFQVPLLKLVLQAGDGAAVVPLLLLQEAPLSFDVLLFFFAKQCRIGFYLLEQVLDIDI